VDNLLSIHYSLFIDMITVTFVCLGNICRSPMAEAVFQELVNEVGLADQFKIDSAGTASYHTNEPAHHGTREMLAQHGIDYVGKARQIRAHELAETDYIMAMDSDNLADLQSLTRDFVVQRRMKLLLDYAKGVKLKDVPDPYYSGKFAQVYDLVKIGGEGLLAHIRQERGL